MAGSRSRWTKVLPAATLTAFPFTVFAPTAQAFFPPITPPPPVTVVNPPVSPPVIVVPPVSPPPFVPVSPPPVIVPPPPPPVIVVPPDTPQTPGVPEPSTLVAAMAGLTAAAGWAARRRKQGSSQPAQ